MDGYKGEGADPRLVGIRARVSRWLMEKHIHKALTPPLDVPPHRVWPWT